MRVSLAILIIVGIPFAGAVVWPIARAFWCGLKRRR